MKKLMVVAIAFIALACITGICLAQWDVSTQATEKAPEAVVEKAAVVEVLTGNIVSIDAERNEIVIKDDATGIDRNVKVDPGMTPTLKVGEKVKVKIGEEMIVTEVVKVTEEKVGYDLKEVPKPAAEPETAEEME